MRKRHQKRPAMPQRPRQHELDTEAIEFIRSTLPSRWTREEIKQDYGQDLHFEIFEDGEATALEFRIQSKGHEDFTIRHKDKVIQPLKVSKLNYYEQLPLPILLVVYSAKRKQACYLWLKPYIREVLDKERPDWREGPGDSEISIRVPLSSELNELSHEEILKHVEIEITKIRASSGSPYKFVYREQPSNRHFATSTRLIRPIIKNHLHRPRLTDKINAALDQQSVLIHADAGYGKTWLLQDFIDATTNPLIIIWYNFTRDPLDSLRFVHEVASGFARQTNKIGLETLKLIRERGKEANPDEALALLLEEVAHTDHTPVLLILEDLHNIEDETIHSGILAILTSRSKKLQVVLTSRLPLPNGQAKLIAQARLTVIERPELEFTFDEIKEYLKDVQAVNLSPEQIQFLNERTHGWIAAVGLAVDVLQTNPGQGDKLFNRLIGFEGNIYNFFAEEVYSSQSAENKLLLKRLGIARSIRPEIVDLFTSRSDGGQVLKDLAGRNTFLIEDQNKNGQFRLHALFAEFLTTRFQDEEGSEAVRQTHRKLANHFLSQREWFLAAEHATDAEDWEIAVDCLEIIGQIGVSLGYGKAFLTWIEKIPEKTRSQSASLCELVGLSAFQISDLDTASQEFDRARRLYSDLQDDAALNRLEYYVAEIGLDKGTMTPEEFLILTNRISTWSYQHNEILFGVQVEHRYIQVGQTISTKYGNLLSNLIKRGEALLARIEQLGSDYELIRAKVLASQAHLYFQLVTFAFQQEASKVTMREKLGHPIPMEERVSQAKMVIGTFNAVLSLYQKAEEIAKGESDIEWALIRTSHLTDFAHHLSQVFLLGLRGRAESSSQITELSEEVKKQLFGILAELDKCAEIFGKYHYTPALAKTLCDAADIYDILKDLKNRNRLAKEALEIAGTRGFLEITQRANRILVNQGTFTSMLENIDESSKDETLANLDEEGKLSYVNTFLRSFAGEADLETRREAIASDVDDMVAAAKQRIEWCRHVEIIQDLRHTRSQETMYREIPQKRIVCMELGYQSPKPGLSFDNLWPMFKGVYCLGCRSRSLGKRN